MIGSFHYELETTAPLKYAFIHFHVIQKLIDLMQNVITISLCLPTMSAHISLAWRGIHDSS